MAGWGLALRIAWRDAVRHKARSALVLTLVALPVLLVSAGAIVVATGDVRGVERIERELGAAQATVWTDGPDVVTQHPDPHEGLSYGWESGPRGQRAQTPDEEELVEVLGGDTVVREQRVDLVTVRTPDGDTLDVRTAEADYADPLLEGLVELVTGRLPGTVGEVVVTDDLRRAGFGVGESLPVPDVEPAPTVVGVVEAADRVSGELAYGLPGSLLAPSGPRSDTGSTTWFVGGDEVTWDEVRELNRLGFVVFSRAVVADPPPDSEVLEESWASSSEEAEYVAVMAMIVVMVLLEVVLLAGPAFAVTARNHTRTLALVAASGGTPRQARRVILAGGLVLGLGATVTGLLLSVPLAALVVPQVQRFTPERLGPFEVPWPWLLAVAAFGLTSALLAAVVPAWLASRQDVVAALAGRRSDGAPRLRVPALGAVVLLLGIAGASFGAQHQDDLGPVLMATSAVVTMVGMILVVPAVVAVVARASRGLPLPMRYATRDAARHRTRTVPAIAAVAATVAGVVALGIGNASDEKENRETYEPIAALGTGLVSFDTDMTAGDAVPPWDALEAAAAAAVPEAEVHPVRGLRSINAEARSDHWSVRRGARGAPWVLDSWRSTFSVSAFVADAAPETGLSAADREAVAEVLESGKVALLADREPRRTVDEVTLVHRVSEVGRARVVERVTLPAEVVRVEGTPWSEAVIPTVLEDRFQDGDVATVGLTVASQLTEAEEQAAAAAIRAVSPRAELYVERGHVRDPVALILLWVLGAVGALLMLAGTLTATFLSLADAKPDLATVQAVGGAPRTRRAVAASYALMIAAVGAVLGAAVGFVPGIAVSRSLTITHYYGDTPTGPFLEIPWLLIGSLVVALPLLSAAVVWLCSRSRLPMVARLD